MGWLGIVFKGDIIHFWDLLAIGLSTGFLGSLTTFNAWNQKMLELTLEGKWALSIMGFFVGMSVIQENIVILLFIRHFILSSWTQQKDA